MARAAEGGRPGPNERIPFVDFFLINIPVWLFISLAAVSGLFASRLVFPLAMIPLCLLWWSLCGAGMLALDFYTRKRSLYLRLRSTGAPGRGAAVTRTLKQTLCGYALYAAALRYSRSLRA